MSKTLIFDFDGTIANSFDNACLIVHKYTEKYTKIDLSVSELKELYQNNSIYTIMKIYGIKDWQVPILYYKIGREFRLDIKKVKIFDNIQVVLKKLKKERFHLIILSNNNKKNIFKFLKKEKLDDIFETVYTSRLPLRKDIKLNKILRKEKLDKKEVIYVGDEVKDIIASKRCGIKIAAVCWGFNSKKLLEKHSPDFLVEKPQGLIEVLK